MAHSEEHYAILKTSLMDPENGYLIWNKWRSDNNIQNPNLSGLNLEGVVLKSYNLAGVNLIGSNLSNSIILETSFFRSEMNGVRMENATTGFLDFSEADLTDAILFNSKLTMSRFMSSICLRTNFSNSSLTGSHMGNSNLQLATFENSELLTANLANCQLQNAIFKNAVMSGVNLSNSNLTGATIIDSIVFGTSSWNIDTTESIQKNLTITNHKDESVITVDDLEIAQFIYLIVNNNKIANAVDKITSKVVLILGRFYPERKEVLDKVKTIMKSHDFVPVLFDFTGPSSRDFTETIGLLGRMSRFIIADITDAKSIPQELNEIIPHNPSIKIQPILLKGEKPYSMFEHWQRYEWVNEIFEYTDEESLLNFFQNEIDKL